MIPREEWEWFGNAGHFICGRWCQFHLCTRVGPWLVSTVGQYWPDRPVREIHAEVADPAWLAANKHLRGENFDAAYMKRFDYEEIGFGRTFESMVFEAGERCAEPGCGCGMPTLKDASERDFDGYKTAGAATLGHETLCLKWAAITVEQANAERAT